MIYAYAPDASDYECMGLCGALTPTRCTHEERAGGLSELTMEHPIDDLGRFSCIGPGVILKVPVPVRTTPEIAETGQIVASVESWQTKPTSARDDRLLWSRPKNGKKLAIIPVNVTVTVVDKQGDMYKIKAGAFGTGWIASISLELVTTQLIPETTDAIEAVEPSFSVRNQLFRVYECEQTDQSLFVRARHISYDLLGNLTMYSVASAALPDALNGILGQCIDPHDFVARTDIGDARNELSYARTNPIKALLDPETGCLNRFRAQLVRDDFEIFLLRKAGLDRGVSIEYGKNLLGLELTLSWDGVVTGILPLGEAEDGSVLTLEDPVMMSARAGDYPMPRVQVLNVSGAKVDKKVSVALARQRLREAAQAQFDAGCDLPGISLKVDFVRHADTESIGDFSPIEDVFLYDSVRVLHRPLGIEIKTQVVQTKFDCLRGRFDGITLGSIAGGVATGSIASWQIPAGISGGKLLMGSVNGGALADDIITTRHLQAESITAEQISTDALYAQKIVAAVCELVSANIQRAQIGEANIDWAQIVNLNALIGSVARAQITEATIAEANINWAQIANLSASMATIAKAQLTTATINDANIDWAQIASIQSAVADMTQAAIGSADIGYASVKDLVTGTSIITEGEAGQLYIGRLSVTEANMVSITVGKLVLKTEDGRFCELVVGEDGAVTTKPTEVCGEDLEPDSLPGDRIIEDSITARELNVAQIYASDAMIGRIKSAHIDVAELFANQATFGRVTANHIASDALANLDLRSNISIRQMTKTDYITLDEHGLTIGKTDPSSHFNVNIQSDSVRILQDGNPIASFQGNTLHAFQAEIAQTIAMGSWQWEAEADGGLSLYHL